MIHYKLEDIERAERNIKRYGWKCYTLEDVAKLLGVTRKTLYNWHKKGLIKYSIKCVKRPMLDSKGNCFKYNGKFVVFDSGYYDAQDILNQLKG